MEIHTKIINAIFRLIGSKRMKAEAIKHPARSDTIRAMKRVFNRFQVNVVDILGHGMATCSVKNPTSHLHIIYLHGGAYVYQGDFIHWSFIKKIIHALACKATCIDYPLAPEYAYTDTFEMLRFSYDHLVRSYPEDQFILMGDSAGGGLALAFAQQLKKENHPVQPEKLILLSPWLDLKLDNPDINKVEPLDPILAVDALQLAGDLYAGGADKSDFHLSPINGNLNGLGEISIFIGTHDILWPDCRKISSISESAGENLSLFKYDGMPHTWMLFPGPSARKVRAQIVDLLAE